MLSILLSDLIAYGIKTLKIFILELSNCAIEFAAKYKQSILFKIKVFEKKLLYRGFQSEKKWFSENRNVQKISKNKKEEKMSFFFLVKTSGKFFQLCVG